MKKKIILKSLLSICILATTSAGALYAIAHPAGHDLFPPDALQGKWKGEGNIIVSWCKQRYISLELEIDPDGTVCGRVGDAILKNAVIAPNSGLLVLLGNPRYAIEATLKGPLVKAESIQRKSLVILLDLKEDALEGGLHTHDSKFGGRDTMMFSVTDIRLEKSE